MGTLLETLSCKVYWFMHDASNSQRSKSLVKVNRLYAHPPASVAEWMSQTSTRVPKQD